MPLTDTALRSAKPQAKAFRLFDGGGLYLEVSPAGGYWPVLLKTDQPARENRRLARRSEVVASSAIGRNAVDDAS